jgi:transcriptional regulator with XRE-family HTH domain
MTEFRIVLRRCRADAGLSQQRLADLAELARIHIAKLETGDRDNPGLAVLQRLTSVLGAPFANALARECLFAKPRKRRKRTAERLSDK